MKATVWYKHEAENYASMSPYRKADTDEMFVQFLPEGDETLPFPTDENMISFTDFVQWFNERFAAAEMLTDEQAITLPTIYPVWGTEIVYAENDRVRYEDVLYRCVQAHTSQADWMPPAAPALWVAIADPAEEWPAWVQPTGAHDAYAKDAKVSHIGKHWISDIDANVYEPGVACWSEVV